MNPDLAESFAGLKQRFQRIVVGQTRCGKPVRAEEFGAAGAMTALLKDAIKPNLVPTLESNPASDINVDFDGNITGLP